ncbi:hypothetical protein [Streptomyces sp. B22F1]|uniref:hypothetical protein n=1 Tax=Streptomyces sp. B22F1 TaxID=3153566 RepID=UPI00325CBF6E
MPSDSLLTVERDLPALLVGDVSVALNRAAMTSPEPAALLLRHSGQTTGALVAACLLRLADDGHLRNDDPVMPSSSSTASWCAICRSACGSARLRRARTASAPPGPPPPTASLPSPRAPQGRPAGRR